MAKHLKSLMAEAVRNELDGADNLLVLGLLPMTAESNHQLRRELRGLSAGLRVIHNRTAAFALDEGRRELAQYFVGQTALTLVRGEDPDLVSIAKTLVGAARRKYVEIRGGFVDGEILDRQAVELLSTTPDKPTLRAMLAGAVAGPARGLAATVLAVPGSIARCLQARIDKDGGADAS